MMSFWISSVWYPPSPAAHTERNRPSNVEFDGLFSLLRQVEAGTDSAIIASHASGPWRRPALDKETIFLSTARMQVQ